MRPSSLRILTIFTLCSTPCYISLSQNDSQDFLDAHNEARAEVGVAPLEWDNTVAAYAQEYANTRIQECDMEHSGGPYGENIAGRSFDMNATEAVKYWVTERPNYDYDSNTCVSDECLHYTQVVWNETFQLGCARSKCNNGWTFVICNYNPPGNFMGQRPY